MSPATRRRHKSAPSFHNFNYLCSKHTRYDDSAIIDRLDGTGHCIEFTNGSSRATTYIDILHGSDGKDGKDGADGKDGKDGAPGAKGEAGGASDSKLADGNKYTFAQATSASTSSSRNDKI